MTPARLLPALAAALLLAGCAGGDKPARLRVFYSTDFHGEIEPCG